MKLSHERRASSPDACPGQISWDYDRAELIADGAVHAIGICLGLIGAVTIVVIHHETTQRPDALTKYRSLGNPQGYQPVAQRYSGSHDLNDASCGRSFGSLAHERPERGNVRGAPLLAWAGQLPVRCLVLSPVPAALRPRRDVVGLRVKLVLRG